MQKGIRAKAANEETKHEITNCSIIIVRYFVLRSFVVRFFRLAPQEGSGGELVESMANSVKFLRISLIFVDISKKVCNFGELLILCIIYGKMVTMRFALI